MPRVLVSFALLLAFSVAAADEPIYVLETKDAEHVIAKYPYSVTCPKMKATDWIVLFPQLPELPGQTKVKSTLATVPPSINPAILKERGPLGRTVLALRIQARAPELKTTMNVLLTYEATLRSRALVKLESGGTLPKVPDLSPAERKKALAATARYDFETPAFKKWLEAEKLRREEKESDVDFARRAFLALRGKMSFFYTPTMDRKPSAIIVTKKSDDAGLSNLFVAVMRANKIPAHGLFGRFAESATKGIKGIGDGMYYQWQVKSEFFADGVGWVPVDLGSAKIRDESKEGLTFFGRDPGHFLTFHVDQDLTVEVPLMGIKTLENMQSANWFVRGEGSAEAPQFRHDWKVEKLP
jgi:hypothetical protein